MGHFENIFSPWTPIRVELLLSTVCKQLHFKWHNFIIATAFKCSKDRIVEKSQRYIRKKSLPCEKLNL